MEHKNDLNDSEFEIEGTVLYKYRGQGGDVKIPQGVTLIMDFAFYYCRGLTGITIPNSVISIGEYAFCGCSGLTNITIPDSVKSISYNAFADCGGLTNITIPDSVVFIGVNAFNVCSGLKTIYCRAEKQPAGWDHGWNRVGDDGTFAKVVWGYKG